jgi:hypothetical protein
MTGAPSNGIGDRLGCSPETVLSCAEQLGLRKPTADKQGGSGMRISKFREEATESFETNFRLFFFAYPGIAFVVLRRRNVGVVSFF